MARFGSVLGARSGTRPELELLAATFRVRRRGDALRVVMDRRIDSGADLNGFENETRIFRQHPRERARIVEVGIEPGFVVFGRENGRHAQLDLPVVSAMGQGELEPLLAGDLADLDRQAPVYGACHVRDDLPGFLSLVRHMPCGGQLSGTAGSLSTAASNDMAGSGEIPTSPSPQSPPTQEENTEDTRARLGM